MIDVSPTQLQTIQAILKRIAPTCEARVFGSRYQWTAKDYSDLDLAMVGDGKLPFKKLSALRTAFEESDLPYRVDVLDWHAISPEFQKVIERGYEVIQMRRLVANSNEWIETTIGEFCPFEYGKSLKETDRQTGNVPVFGSNGRVGYHNQAIVESKGVIIGRKGTAGAVHYSDEPFCPIDTTFYVAESPDKDIRYIYFLLKSVGLEHMNSDSAVPGLNRTAAHSRIIEVPKSLEEQRAIAGVLGALDDKIELNRRMNRTLESMARGVFAEMMKDELGRMKVGTVGEDFNLTMGQSPPGETYNEKGEGIPFFQGCADFGFRYPENRVYCTSPTRFAKAGDTLVSVRAPVGDVNMAKEECAIGRGVAAVRHKTGSRSYTYYAMKSLEEDFRRFEAEGTVFGSINKADFQNLEIGIPTTEQVEQFEKICYPIDQMIENNEKESRTLASLRDSLLPKLMRGEVRVK